jgi:hypothetical protein
MLTLMLMLTALALHIARSEIRSPGAKHSFADACELLAAAGRLDCRG